jgi:predicted GIY-YIG superfamily endonuclease
LKSDALRLELAVKRLSRAAKEKLAAPRKFAAFARSSGQYALPRVVR